MRLSIIIPYYNTKKFTEELMRVLTPQRNKETEIIVVDDGSNSCYFCEFEGVKTIRKANGGVSSARNRGLKEAKGEYVVFVDSDDLVSEDYIEQIFKAIESKPDTVYLSWRSIDGKLGKTIRSEADEFNPWNRCVWNRVFKKEWLNGLQFDESKRIAEDDDFLNHLPEAKTKTYVEKPIYLYRAGRTGSLTYRAKQGEFMADGTEKPRIKAQVVVYCANMQKIGGIETWIYYWCKNMYQLYDIIVVFSENMDGRQIARISEVCQVLKLNNHYIDCDTLINTRITDKIPEQIRAKKIIQMVHGCYSTLFCCDIQPERDKVVCVSKVVKDSYQGITDAEVIHNFTLPTKPKKSLFLITASRFTREKGGDRMIKLAEALKRADIPFIWFVFSHQNTKLVDGMVKMPETMDVRSWIAKCDYLVQLSDAEGFGYSIVEALELGVPVITTPIDVLKEIYFNDREDGYIVPFDMEDINVERFLDVPTIAQYRGDTNEHIKSQWKKLLGRSKPTGDYLKVGNMVQVEIIENYSDMELNRDLKIGEVVTMRRARANLIVGCGKGVIIK